MKNYLVKTLFKVNSTNWHVHDRKDESNLHENYLEMHRISLASCNKFLQGNWELKFLDGEVDDISQAFEKTFWFIHDLWHSEPCNILYTDPDTLCIRPVEFWGKYDTFRMFNYTDPKEFLMPNRYNRWFDHYFNAGVRYFPSTMSESTWKTGTDLANDWVYEDYNTEQIILNAMMWDQGLTKEQVFEPHVAWQMFNGDLAFGQRWNKVPITSSSIIHLHGSRHAESRVQIMQDFERRNLQ